jgi:hypothetical protein
MSWWYGDNNKESFMFYVIMMKYSWISIIILAIRILLIFKIEYFRPFMFWFIITKTKTSKNIHW